MSGTASALAEKVCVECDGLGELRWHSSEMTPYSNVAGWMRTTLGGKTVYVKRCPHCKGSGFTRLRSLPPCILKGLTR